LKNKSVYTKGTYQKIITGFNVLIATRCFKNSNANITLYIGFIMKQLMLSNAKWII